MTFRYVFSYCLTACVCALCAFAILMKLTSDVGREGEVKALRACIISIIIYDLSNAIWIWSNYGFLHLPFWIASQIVNSSAISFCAYYWFVYIIMRVHRKKNYSKAVRALAHIPLAADIFIVLASPFTGWVFRHTTSGVFAHGRFYIAHALLASAYIIVALVYTVIARAAASTPSEKSEAKASMAFMICPLVAFIVYTFVYDLPSFELAMLFGFLIVFINLQESRIYTDALTELNNRRHADEVLFTKIKNVTMRNPLYLFIADLDGFKKINDTYGHIEGDKALKIMADTFKKVGAEQRGFFARWGGDEFVMIIEHQYLESPDSLMRAIRNALAREVRAAALPYTFTCSIGYAVCMSPNTDMADLTKEADAMLYEDKKVAHSRVTIAPKEK